MAIHINIVLAIHYTKNPQQQQEEEVEKATDDTAFAAAYLSLLDLLWYQNGNALHCPVRATLQERLALQSCKAAHLLFFTAFWQQLYSMIYSMPVDV